MATMLATNKAGKRRRGKCKKRRVPHRDAAAAGAPEQAAEVADVEPDGKAVSALRAAAVRLLLESGRCGVSGGGGSSQGRRPLRMVLASRSSPSSCLRYLLDRGADVNATTDTGQTPLHLAAAEGLLDCTEMLVRAGADVLARDSMGHTPLDSARIWCHREVARYLKSCMWQAEKVKEMEERKQVQALYNDLVDMAKTNDLSKKTLIDEKVAEWAKKKGLPVLRDSLPRPVLSRYHTQCLSSDQVSSNPKHAQGAHAPRAGRPHGTTSTKPPASSSRPWAIYTGLRPDGNPREPDLRDSVTLWKDGASRLPRFATKWGAARGAAPDLPLDVLERVFFPRAFPPRLTIPQRFETQDIMKVQHRGRLKGRSTSLWTEVAMHLPEVLEPGHI